MESINNMKRTSANELPSMVWRSRANRAVIYLPFSIILLFFLLVLHGCTEEDDEDNQKDDTFNGTVKAKVENGASYEAQIKTVWALYDAEVNNAGELRGRMLASGDYESGGFTITLPEIPASFLMNVQTFFTSGLNISAELEIDEPDARILDADFFGITGDNNYVDYFTYTNKDAKRTTCLFVYADSNVTVKDGNNIDVSLKRGWNRIYWTPSDKKASTKAPSGMKWYLSSKVN